MVSVSQYLAMALLTMYAHNISFTDGLVLTEVSVNLLERRDVFMLWSVGGIHGEHRQSNGRSWRGESMLSGSAVLCRARSLLELPGVYPPSYLRGFRCSTAVVAPIAKLVAGARKPRGEIQL